MFGMVPMPIFIGGGFGGGGDSSIEWVVALGFAIIFTAIIPAVFATWLEISGGPLYGLKSPLFKAAGMIALIGFLFILAWFFMTVVFLFNRG
jgi:hypothetical protein